MDLQAPSNNPTTVTPPSMEMHTRGHRPEHEQRLLSRNHLRAVQVIHLERDCADDEHSECTQHSTTQTYYSGVHESRTLHLLHECATNKRTEAAQELLQQTRADQQSERPTYMLSLSLSHINAP
jgi:hypothetical protein